MRLGHTILLRIFLNAYHFGEDKDIPFDVPWLSDLGSEKQLTIRRTMSIPAEMPAEVKMRSTEVNLTSLRIYLSYFHDNHGR
jgi:hypothetical protein